MGVDSFIIVASLLFSAFFSGMEIAFISANKIHIEIEKKQGGFLSKVLVKLTKSPSKFIATMLIGNNVALVVYGFFMGDLLLSLFQDWSVNAYPLVKVVLIDFSLLSQTVISTLVILLTAEFLPKVLFQIYANTLIKALALPAYVFYFIFSWVSEFVIFISDLILKVFFKTDGDAAPMAFSKLEIGDYINEQMEAVALEDEVDSEIQIFQNALEFSAVKAREVMVPRTDLSAVDFHDTPKSLVKIFTETGFSKLLVYQDTIDNIIGYVHSYELFKKPKTIKSMLLPIEYVPETMLINDILDLLIKKRKSIAIVLDEYGGTSGMVTIEDIIEELFGEIEDEHDSTDHTEEVIGLRTYKFSARLEVDYLNETYHLNLPERDEYGTLGGLIVHVTGQIPTLNESIIIGDFCFTILEVSGNKIDMVSLEVLEKE
ncbi:MAG: hemolysin family protein [Flavobacteriaceae bacterium]